MCYPLLQEGKYVSAARVLELMRGAGLAPTVQAYTSYMDACVKADTATSLARAFQVRLADNCIHCSPVIQMPLTDQMDPYGGCTNSCAHLCHGPSSCKHGTTLALCSAGV